MTPEEVAQIARDSMEAALKSERERQEAEKAAADKRQAEIDEAVKAALTVQAREFAKSNRLQDRKPAGDPP